MTRLAALDSKLVERFIRTQPLRHPVTPKNYAGTLRNFNSFVARHGDGALPTLPILRQWLKESSLKWPAHILYHRTSLVERYLGWLQEQGVIASNPFAELHLHYGPRTTPIVRALVCEDNERALQILRRLPPFGSFLGKVMEVTWRICVRSDIGTTPIKNCCCASIASCSAARICPNSL
jgi:integrase/recombinase XerD